MENGSFGRAKVLQHYHGQSTSGGDSEPSFADIETKNKRIFEVSSTDHQARYGRYITNEDWGGIFSIRNGVWTFDSVLTTWGAVSGKNSTSVDTISGTNNVPNHMRLNLYLYTV